MAIHKLRKTADEKDFYPIQLDFKDENDDAAAPKTLQWTLTDSRNRVINSRENVVVGGPAATTYILLYNADLALSNNDNRQRILTAEWTFDSATYGNDMPKKEQIHFMIKNYENIV